MRLILTILASFPNKPQRTATVKSIGMFTACPVVLTRIAVTLVSLCKTKFTQSREQNILTVVLLAQLTDLTIGCIYKALANRRHEEKKVVSTQVKHHFARRCAHLRRVAFTLFEIKFASKSTTWSPKELYSELVACTLRETWFEWHPIDIYNIKCDNRNWCGRSWSSFTSPGRNNHKKNNKHGWKFALQITNVLFYNQMVDKSLCLHPAFFFSLFSYSRFIHSW